MARGWVMPKEVVLDAGCGTGYGTYLLALNCEKAIGIDIDEGCITQANRDWRLENTEFVVGDLSLMELPEVDVAIAIETIEHLDNMHHFAEELKKKVKRLIVITVPIGGTSFAYKKEKPSPATEKNDFMNDGEVDKLFFNGEWKKQTGFRYGYSYFGVYFREEPKKP